MCPYSRIFPVNLKKKSHKIVKKSGLIVNFLQSTAASNLDVSVGNEAEVVLLEDGHSRGVQSAGVLGCVVVFNSNLL